MTAAIVTRRVRATGTMISVGRASAFGLSEEDGPWASVCEEHGTIGNSATKLLAQAATGLDFCDACRELVKRKDAPEAASAEGEPAKPAPARKTKRFRRNGYDEFDIVEVELEDMAQTRDYYEAGDAYFVYLEGELVGEISSYETQTERPLGRGSMLVSRGKPFTAWAPRRVGERTSDYYRQCRSQAEAIRALLPRNAR